MVSVEEARRRIILSSPHIVTPTSAALQTFNTDMVAPLKECKVHFSPVQEGSGDPSPENVRPISGWNRGFVETYSELINLIPDNWTTGTVDNGTLTYTGDNTFSFTTDGNVATGAFTIPIQSFTILPTDTLYFKIVIDFNYTATMVGIALRDANKKNIVAINVYPDGIQHVFGASSSWDVTKIPTTLRIGIQNGNATKISIFISKQPFVTFGYNWSSTLGTVYGGYVDLIRGKLVVNRCLTTIDGTQTVQVREQYTNTNAFRIARSQLPIEPAGYDESDIANYMSLAKGNDANNFPAWSFYINSSTKALHMLFPKTFTTNTQVSNYFTNNPLKVSYHIQATEYAIDPVILKTLRGINNIWSDANGNIDISYWTH